jgi:hypothetical protein
LLKVFTFGIFWLFLYYKFNYMRTHSANTYFETQGQAIRHIEEALAARKYELTPTDNLRFEHVSYETTVHYNFPLQRTDGKNTKRWLHIQMYRMPSGRYEANYYLS